MKHNQVKIDEARLVGDQDDPDNGRHPPEGEEEPGDVRDGGEGVLQEHRRDPLFVTRPVARRWRRVEELERGGEVGRGRSWRREEGKERKGGVCKW